MNPINVVNLNNWIYLYQEQSTVMTYIQDAREIAEKLQTETIIILSRDQPLFDETIKARKFPIKMNIELCFFYEVETETVSFADCCPVIASFSKNLICWNDRLQKKVSVTDDVNIALTIKINEKGELSNSCNFMVCRWCSTVESYSILCNMH